MTENLFTYSYRVTKEDVIATQDPELLFSFAEKEIERQFLLFAARLLSEGTETEETDDYFDFNLHAYVFSKEEFRQAVRESIRKMTDEEVRDIRNGND